MNPVKLGIIGCGIAAKKLHWPALQRLNKKFKITAVCNRSEAKAKDFAGLVGGVPYVLDYHDLLSRSDVEAVDIIIPFHLNYPVTRDALAAGMHVLVEKPLAANLKDADKMLHLEKKYGSVKMVAENFYYHPLFYRVKELLADDRIGAPYAVFWDVFRLIEKENPYAQTQWRLSERYPGGFIVDGGIHNIAALHLLFGEITMGCSWAKTVNPEIGGIDSFSCQFQTKNDVHGTLNLFVSACGHATNHLLILGKKASIEVNDYRELVVKDKDDILLHEIVELKQSYVKEFEDFYLAIRTNHDVVSTFAKGYRDFSFLNRAIG